RLAAEECAEQLGPRGCSRRQLSGVPRDDGGNRCASGIEGDQSAGANDKHLEGRRFLPQRSVSRDLWIRLCSAARGTEDRRPAELEGRPVQLLSRPREL